MAGRTRRPTLDEPSIVSPESQPSPVTDQMGVELLEDRTRIIAGGSTGRRFSASVPGAVAGVFLMVALALGAGGEPAFEPTGAGHDGASAGETTGDGDAKTDGESYGNGGDGEDDKPDTGSNDEEADSEDKTDGETSDEPKTAEPDGDKPDETPDEPKSDETPVETPDEPSSLELALALEGSAVVVEWSRCDDDGFHYYKIVRSTNESVSWPLGDGDTLVAVREDQATGRLVDTGAKAGRTHYYRVFGVGGDKGILCRTTTKSITTPEPEPEPEPKPDPQPEGFWLDAFLGEGYPVLKWGSCGDVDFTKFKIVRSLDATVTWPTGENDVLIGAMGPDGHKFWDKDAPGGKTLFYRVFCVKSTEAGYVVAAASNVDSVTTPAYEPPPPPVGLGFEANLTGEGVVLHWQECTSDAFSFYKVVRSMNENPSYLPYTDGTQVIGVIENHSVTGLTDGDVASGQTWYYRVQAIGYWNGQKVVLGQTAVIAVTIP